MGIYIRDNAHGRCEVGCGSCGGVIYDDTNAFVGHCIEGLPDGRTKLTSRTFGVLVHLCAEGAVEAATIAEVETVLMQAAYSA